MAKKIIGLGLLGGVLGGGSFVFIMGLVLEVSPPLWSVGAFISATVAMITAVIGK